MTNVNLLEQLKDNFKTFTPAPNPWKKVVDHLIAEKTEMEDFYEKKIRKLKLQVAFGPSSDDDSE